MKNASAFALFCEDVRREAAGRETLIGVMSDTLNVPSFPGNLRRLSVYARIRLSTDFSDFEKPIRITLAGPDGNEVKGGIEEPIPREMIERGISRAKAANLPYASIIGKIRVAEPVQIDKSCTLFVYLHLGEDSEICGLLNIVLRAVTSSTPSLEQAASATSAAS